MTAANSTVRALLGLDVGMARTGVSIARSIVLIASPLTTLTDQEHLPEQVSELVRQHDAIGVVVGLPRDMNGNSTTQTAYVQSVVNLLEAAIPVPVYLIDEAVTSVQAEAELKSRHKPYRKEDIDMLSATYILDDYLQQHPEVFSDVS